MFTGYLTFIIDFVNIVNYKVYMSDKNITRNQESKVKITLKEDHMQNVQSGIYLRDDHCDWGSSGMNEFTNEYGESK